METEPQARLEQEPSAVDKTIRDLLGHLEQHQFGLGQEQFDALIHEITTNDLRESYWAKQTGRTPLAEIHGRSITFDKGFEHFSDAQRLHVLAHEYSHGLSWFLSQQQNPEKFQAIVDQLGLLPSKEVSYYVNFLESKMPEDDGKANFMMNEKLAEVFAQYMESDRSFSGFMQAKLLEFPPGEEGRSPEEIETFQQLAEEIGSLQEYLDIADNEHDREVFMRHHDKLGAHYFLWRSVDEVFRETDWSQLKPEDQTQNLDWDGYDDALFWEEYELANHVHPEVVVKMRPRTALKNQESERQLPRRSFVGDLINFWDIFA
jgi:hypothetical protein